MILFVTLICCVLLGLVLAVGIGKFIKVGLHGPEQTPELVKKVIRWKELSNIWRVQKLPDEIKKEFNQLDRELTHVDVMQVLIDEIRRLSHD